MRGSAARLARVQWAPLTALAVLALVSALLAVVLPARMAAGYDRGVRDAVGAADVEVQGRTDGAAAAAAVPGRQVMTGTSIAWQQLMPPSLRGVVGEVEPSATTDRMRVAGDFEVPRLLYLGWDTEAWRRVRVVAGRPAINPPLEPGRDMAIMVSKAYADRLGYKVGDRVAAGTGPEGLDLRISGLFVPADPADPFWKPRAKILRPTTELLGADQPADTGTALIDDTAYAELTRVPSRELTFRWRFPVVPGEVSAADAGEVRGAAAAYRTAVQGRSDLFPCTVVSPLDARLETFTGRLGTAEAVLGLALGGLAAVAGGVLLLAAGLLAERLRPVLGTMRARGASLPQLAVPACGLTALAAVPPAALGYAAGLLLDAGPPQPRSAYAVAALVAAVLALPLAMVARERGGGLESSAGRRDDLGSARPSRRRLVLDALLAALAATGVVLVRVRGGTSGADPLVTAMPVLLGAAVGVLVLRAYPYLLRAAGPLLRRGRGAVPFLGLARASRQGLVGAAPLVFLVLAAAVAGFAATADHALRVGQERGAWAEVGADARLGTGQLDAGGLDRIRALPGVTGAVEARVIEDVATTRDPAPLVVVGIDLAAYRKLAPDVPGVPGSASGALVSPDADHLMGSGAVTLTSPDIAPIRVRPVAEIERFPGQDPGTPFVIVPYRLVAAEKEFPSQVFVAGDGLDAGRLRAAASPGDTGRDVVLRQTVLRGLTGGPMVSVVHETFRNGALVAGVYGLLAVLLVLVVGARERGGVVARLRALGLSRGQSRGLALVEIAPVLLCAVGAGWVLGLLLPDIAGPVVDLRPYTGGHAITVHVPGAPALLGLIAALLVAAAAAVAVDRAFDARPGTALRTGE